MANALSGYYRWDTDLGLVADPKGNDTETIRSLATALFDSTVVKGEKSGIKEYLFSLSQKSYKSNPLTIHFFNSMIRLKNIHFFEQFPKLAEAYLALYEGVPGIQALLPALAEKYPATFEGIEYLKDQIIERLNDPLLIPCLEAIAHPKSNHSLMLFAWFQVNRSTKFDRHTYDYLVMLKDLPSAWIKRELMRFPELRDIELPPDVMDLSYKDFSYAIEHRFFYQPGEEWSLKAFKVKTGQEYNFQEWESRFPQERCKDQADLYILKRPGFVETYRYGNQTVYGALMHQSVLIGEYGLNEYLWGFKELFALAQLRRNHISFRLQHEGRGEFGLPTRTGYEIITKCNKSHYTELGKELTVLFGPIAQKHQLSARFRVDGFPDIPLFHDTIDFKGVDNVVVIHTRLPKWRQAILERLEVYFNATHTEHDPKIILRRMGLVFYWFCRGKFVDRGDPSMAEMIVRAYLRYRGITLGAWKEGIVPWEKVVLSLDPEEFADTFHTLFEI